MINKINSNQNFQGIKLTHSNPFSTRVIVDKLKKAGYYCYGAKTYNIVSFSDKQFVFSDIRFRNDFLENEFGVVFFPNNTETYIIAALATEQNMLNIINKIDKRAHINLLF